MSDPIRPFVESHEETTRALAALEDARAEFESRITAVELSGSSAAPGSAKYILKGVLPVAGLPNAQAMGDLTTGIVKNTTTTGVQSIAVEGTDYYKPGGTDVAVADGGTGASTAAGAFTNLGVSAFVQTIFDDVNAAAVRATIGAGTGSGDALVANPLSQFAATTSLQLKGVISDETGSGLLVFATSPTLTTPTIADFSNANHGHQNAAGGGTLDTAALGSGTLAAARMPALTGDVTTSAGSIATTIANDAVTYAKMQNVSATDKVLGRSTAGAGDVEEITCTAGGRAIIALTLTQGDVIYGTGANTAAVLAKNTTATRYLSNTGTSNNPAWAQVDVSNGVTGDLPFANLTQITARSVLGVTGNSTADVAAIQGTANQVLVINSAGTALAFGQVNLASSAAVTGLLPVANGGTGTATPNSGRIIASVIRIMPSATLFSQEGVIAGGSTPAESYPTNDHDSAIIEYTDFLCRLYPNYVGTTGLTFEIDAVSGTTGNVVFGVSVRELDTDITASFNYDTQGWNDATQAVGTANVPFTTTVTKTDGSQIDSWSPSKLAVVRVRRNATDAADTVNGADVRILALTIKET